MIKLRAALRRWYPLLFIGVFLGAIVGGASVSIQPEAPTDYDATSIVLLELDGATVGAQQNAQQAGLRVRRGGVPVRAAELLERNDPAALVAKVAVDVESDSLSLVIRATDEDPDTAAAIADAFTTAFLETSNQQELDALDEQIELLERQVESAQRRLEEFDSANPLIAPLTDVRVPLVRDRSELVSEIANLTQQLEETAQRRESTTGPYSRLGEPAVAEAAAGVVSLPSNPVVRVILLAVIGAALAALVIALIERVNPRIDTKEEAEAAMGIPVLAMVPFLGRRDRTGVELVGPEHFGGGYAESYRRLRSAMHFASAQDATPTNGSTPANGPSAAGSSFLIVSASPGEGKTSTVAFAAFALAESDVPTVAVNADSRRPTLHRRLGVGAQPGLSDLADRGPRAPQVDDLTQQGPIENLWVVASGQPGPLSAELVGAAHEVIRVATSRGATVVVDSSPLLATADVMELLPLVDHVIFVVRQGRTTRAEVREALEMLRLRDAPVLGCVCIGSAASKRKYSYYESYYFDSSAASPPTGPTRDTLWTPDGDHDLPGDPSSPPSPPPYRSPVSGDRS